MFSVRVPDQATPTHTSVQSSEVLPSHSPPPVSSPTAPLLFRRGNGTASQSYSSSSVSTSAKDLADAPRSPPMAEVSDDEEDIRNGLRRLARLQIIRDSGFISDEEYQRRKSHIIDEMTETTGLVPSQRPVSHQPRMHSQFQRPPDSHYGLSLEDTVSSAMGAFDSRLGSSPVLSGVEGGSEEEKSHLLTSQIRLSNADDSRFLIPPPSQAIHDAVTLMPREHDSGTDAVAATASAAVGVAGGVAGPSPWIHSQDGGVLATDLTLRSLRRARAAQASQSDSSPGIAAAAALAAVGVSVPPKEHQSRVKPVKHEMPSAEQWSRIRKEKAVKYLYCYERNEWQKSNIEVKIDEVPFDSGALRDVFYLYNLSDDLKSPMLIGETKPSIVAECVDTFDTRNESTPSAGASVRSVGRDARHQSSQRRNLRHPPRKRAVLTRIGKMKRGSMDSTLTCDSSVISDGTATGTGGIAGSAASMKKTQRKSSMIAPVKSVPESLGPKMKLSKDKSQTNEGIPDLIPVTSSFSLRSVPESVTGLKKGEASEERCLQEKPGDSHGRSDDLAIKDAQKRRAMLFRSQSLGCVTDRTSRIHECDQQHTPAQSIPASVESSTVTPETLFPMIESELPGCRDGSSPSVFGGQTSPDASEVLSGGIHLADTPRPPPSLISVDCTDTAEDETADGDGDDDDEHRCDMSGMLSPTAGSVLMGCDPNEIDRMMDTDSERFADVCPLEETRLRTEAVPVLLQPHLWVAKRSQDMRDNVKGGGRIYFNDVRMQAIARYFAVGPNGYNSYAPPKKVDFLEAFVLQLIDRVGSPICHCERYIQGDYVKYSNNYGWVNPSKDRNTPHAFAHFTFEASRRKLLVCDIQGVRDIYTDPQVHTIGTLERRREFGGRGNQGTRGFEKFLKSHQCNIICRYLGLPNVNGLPYDFSGTLPVAPTVVAAAVSSGAPSGSMYLSGVSEGYEECDADGHATAAVSSSSAAAAAHLHRHSSELKLVSDAYGIRTSRMNRTQSASILIHAGQLASRSMSKHSRTPQTSTSSSSSKRLRSGIVGGRSSSSSFYANSQSVHSESSVSSLSAKSAVGWIGGVNPQLLTAAVTLHSGGSGIGGLIMPNYCQSSPMVFPTDTSVASLGGLASSVKSMENSQKSSQHLNVPGSQTGRSQSDGSEAALISTVHFDPHCSWAVPLLDEPTPRKPSSLPRFKLSDDLSEDGATTSCWFCCVL